MKDRIDEASAANIGSGLHTASYQAADRRMIND